MDAPAVMAMFPPTPLVVDPTNRFTDPATSTEEPDCKVMLPLEVPSPVVTEMAPVAALLSPVLIDALPLLEVLLVPLIIVTEPPVCPVLDPAFNCTEPPSNTEVPTRKAILPAEAADEAPVFNATEPEAPALDPVDTIREPEVPELAPVPTTA